MTAARLWWVRHGPTHAKTFIGWTDRPADLSDTAALARLAAFLPGGRRSSRPTWSGRGPPPMPSPPAGRGCPTCRRCAR